MQFKHAPAAVSAVFDDPNLVSAAGLVPMLRLARSAGLDELAGERLSVPTDKGANAGAKVMALVAGMLAGGPAPLLAAILLAALAAPYLLHALARRVPFFRFRNHARIGLEIGTANGQPRNRFGARQWVTPMIEREEHGGQCWILRECQCGKIPAVGMADQHEMRPVVLR